MYRFFVSEEAFREREVVICGEDVNHIKNVLRMNVGEQITVVCGTGIEYICRIEKMQEQEIFLTVLKEQATTAELPVEITLFQALPKKDKMEFVIQKAVELGATRIVPVKAKRCVVKLDEKKEQKKRVRWQTIAEAAAKQSGRGIIPQVEKCVDFAEALSMTEENDHSLIPYELCETMTESVQAMKQAIQGKSIGVFIGPEGGFEKEEIQQAVEHGVVPISLGSRILRTETAGLTTLSVLMFMIEGKE